MGSKKAVNISNVLPSEMEKNELMRRELAAGEMRAARLRLQFGGSQQKARRAGTHSPLRSLFPTGGPMNASALRLAILATLGSLPFLLGNEPTVKSGKPPNFPFVLAKDKLYHGVFAGNQDKPELFNAAYLKNYTDVIQPGRKLSWVYFSNEWDVDQRFPRAACDVIRCNGATPYIRLMLRKNPYSNASENRNRARKNRTVREDPCKIEDPGRFTLDNISAGCFDKALQQWGRDAAAWGHPVLVEWGTECNGCWFWWNGKHNGEQAGPRKFIRAYRHIVDQIRQGGGNTICWVFHINYESTPTDSWNQPENYFPGEGYANWIGVSLYGSQEPFVAPPDCFADQFDPCYCRLRCMLPDLPIILSEMATTMTHDDSDARWTRAALTAIKSGWKNVRGFAWWNDAFQRYENPKGLVSFRVECNPPLAAVLRDFLKDDVVANSCPR
jgi:hypothetical protein